MNSRQFFDKVVEMRRLQKEYFKSKARSPLINPRRLKGRLTMK